MKTVSQTFPTSEQLLTPEPPWHFLLTDTIEDVRHRLYDYRINARILSLDCSGIRDHQTLYDALWETFDLPIGGGRTFHAIIEMMEEHPWDHRGPFVVVVQNARELLPSHVDLFDTLHSVLTHAAQDLSEPVEIGARWDRPAMPFHTIWVTGPGALAEVRDALQRVEEEG